MKIEVQILPLFSFIIFFHLLFQKDVAPRQYLDCKNSCKLSQQHLE